MFETGRATAKEISFNDAFRSVRLVPPPAYTSRSPPLNCWLELSSDDENYDVAGTDPIAKRREKLCGLNHNFSAFARRSSDVQSSTSMKHSNKDKKPIWKMEFRQPASNYAQFRDTLG